MAQHIINLACIADTYVDRDNPSANYGSSTVLNVGAFVGYRMGPNERYFALAKFDFLSLPARKKIIAASLRLYSTKSVLYNSNSAIKLTELVSSFTEGTTTYNSLGIAYFQSYKAYYENQNIPGNVYMDLDFMSYISSNNVKNNGIAIAWEDRVETPPYLADYCQFSSRSGTNPPMIRITYEDIPPDKPVPKYPSGQYIDNTTIIPFTWDYVSSVGGEQKKFDFQYSTNGGASWTTVSQTTNNTYYNMPANILPSGSVMWKVQTYNEYDEASGYSDINTFYSVGAPMAPSIFNISWGTAKPIISWSATQQEVYQVQVLQDSNVVYDTGNQPYNAYSHKVPVFLSDGSYIAKVRVQNEYGLWSSWAESLFTVTTIKPTKPIAIFQTIRNGVEALVTNTVSAAYFLLLRNDTPVYKTTGNRLYDYSAEHGKEYQYKIREVSSTDTYTDSDIKLMQTTVLGNVFAPASDLSNILELRYNLNKKPDKSFRSGVIINSLLCAGRKYTILEKSEHSEYSVSFVFFTKNMSDIDKLNALVERNDVVLYRDNKGRKIFGNIASFDCVELKPGYQVSFTLSATDYEEGIYD